ncbi:uncharacterized protein APUU_50210S [Aspergillus puulaauensis]|uniref:Uncharacterized protein n=1 Tax=Aspergillus puulaauensis TaxID=1220207 RepID=A0A7R7XRK5_9EURO|nr:uncharacterized protein APUU_50210S [Aspergillus puulaauensis]BCS25499.1 hypothetical protein APUU_50210S [Aspergillus puulaauensis]
MSLEQVGEPVRGAFVAANAAEALVDAGIYNVMVGQKAAGFVGQSKPYLEADFAVEDKQIQRAVDALTHFQIQIRNMHQLRLHRPNGRPQFSDRHHIPAAHFHHNGIALSLHLRSVAMPWLTEGGFAAGHGLTTSTEPQLPPPTGGPEPDCQGPTGPWTNLYPIRIQNPVAFTEGALYMLALHMDKDLSNSNYLRHLYEDILLSYRPEYYRTLQPKFEWAWQYINDYRRPGGHDRYAPLLRLREHMIIHGELPSDLPRWDHSGVPGYALVDSGWDYYTTSKLPKVGAPKEV